MDYSKLLILGDHGWNRRTEEGELCGLAANHHVARDGLSHLTFGVLHSLLAPKWRVSCNLDYKAMEQTVNLVSLSMPLKQRAVILAGCRVFVNALHGFSQHLSGVLWARALLSVLNTVSRLSLTSTGEEPEVWCTCTTWPRVTQPPVPYLPLNNMHSLPCAVPLLLFWQVRGTEATASRSPPSPRRRTVLLLLTLGSDLLLRRWPQVVASQWCTCLWSVSLDAVTGVMGTVLVS